MVRHYAAGLIRSSARGLAGSLPTRRISEKRKPNRVKERFVYGEASQHSDNLCCIFAAQEVS
jgi:hypothetical protein